MECLTYRFASHTEYEPNWRSGRPKKEYACWKQRDPIEILEKRLVENRQLDDSRKAAIHERIQRELDQSIAYAEQQPYTSMEDVYSDVYGCEMLPTG